MAAMRGPRLQVGTAPWIAEERSSALQIVESEIDEFSFSARNEIDWLNEHMAGIFDENETNFANVFKTPGRLRGKTPRTIRKAAPSTEVRVPLSDVFTTTPNGAPPQANSSNTPNPLIRSPKALPGAARPVPQFQPAQDSGCYGDKDAKLAPSSVCSGLESGRQMPNAPEAIKHPTSPCQSNKISAASPSKKSSVTSGEQARQLQKKIVLSDTRTSPMRNRFSKQSRSLSPLKQSPLKSTIIHSDYSEVVTDRDQPESPSEASSPIQRVVRKSSLNFASLPAREPLAAGRNNGRASRVSHLEKSTAGKSIGHAVKDAIVADNNDGDVEMIDEVEGEGKPSESSGATRHTRTYTQRLQDQINQLGKSGSGSVAQTRSYPNALSSKQSSVPLTQSDPSINGNQVRKHSISKVLQTTPGAFPEEDEDEDWIEPPTTAPATKTRPSLPKSYSAGVIETMHGRSAIDHPESKEATNNHLTRSLANGKLSSVLDLPNLTQDRKADLSKSAAVSYGLETVTEYDGIDTPSGSPSRLFRDSPLKQMKSKLSSILKGSKTLLASSAAISAEGKSSLLTPSAPRLGLHTSPSAESIAAKSANASHYPEIFQRAERSLSPSKTRRTRASTERDREDKRREEEAKLMAEQMDRLDKAREREREKARVFTKEQERIATMEREIAIKKQEEQMRAKKTPKSVRTSAGKGKTENEEETEKATGQDVEMTDAPLIPPRSAARATSTTHSLRNRDVKRPVKPTKEDVKSKQAPTVIRVKPGSQHSQLHQAGRQSTNPQDHVNFSSSQHQLNSKASKASLHSKASTQGLKSSTNTRPKITDAAIKKKEMEEKEAQKRRDAKAETERRRIASQEEKRRLDQQRRAEAERQKEKEAERQKEREAERQKEREIARQKEREAMEEQKTAQRQAAREKAKKNKAPPSAARAQPNGPPDFASSQQMAAQKAENQVNKPSARMMTNTQRQATEPVGKSGTKRMAGQDGSEDSRDRRPPTTKSGPAYQATDAKRRRTSEALQDEAEATNQHIKGPPVRPSPGFKKDVPPKSLFQNGYAGVPVSAAHDLFKASVTSQQLQSKATRPVDMAQISKGTIPFAPNSNATGPAFKTPARPGPYPGVKSTVKSAHRSSPQFPNGEAIDLPEIQTDDEDEDEDSGMNNIASWAASPDLRAALMRQETMDPTQIFGPPAPLNMEEVFSKSKDRWHKFRARTSSANWSGPDGLNEEDIRKDLAAREKLRREGGWSYEMSKDVL